jgi:hypothetical protein
MEAFQDYFLWLFSSKWLLYAAMPGAHRQASVYYQIALTSGILAVACHFRSRTLLSATTFRNPLRQLRLVFPPVFFGRFCLVNSMDEFLQNVARAIFMILIYVWKGKWGFLFRIQRQCSIHVSISKFSHFSTCVGVVICWATCFGLAWSIIRPLTVFANYPVLMRNECVIK